jgi:hypothetical protein
MKDSKALRWPYGIALSFILIIGLIYATIVVSLDYPIENSDRNLLNYHEYDKNVNDVIMKQIAFDKAYTLSFVSEPINVDATKIQYKLTDKTGAAINNATIKAMITRPDQHDYDITLENPEVVDGVYSFKSVSLPKEGRWNIIAAINVGDQLRFLNLKADTRYPQTFEY